LDISKVTLIDLPLTTDYKFNFLFEDIKKLTDKEFSNIEVGTNKFLRCENHLFGFLTPKRLAYYNEHEVIKRIVIQALGEDVNVILLEPFASIGFIIEKIHKNASDLVN